MLTAFFPRLKRTQRAEVQQVRMNAPTTLLDMRSARPFDTNLSRAKHERSQQTVRRFLRPTDFLFNLSHTTKPHYINVSPQPRHYNSTNIHQKPSRSLLVCKLSHSRQRQKTAQKAACRSPLARVPAVSLAQLALTANYHVCVQQGRPHVICPAP